MAKKIESQTKKNIDRILVLLRDQGETGLHIRGIAKKLELSPSTVDHIIEKYLEPFIEIKRIDQFGIKAKIVSLRLGKENTSLADVLRFIELKTRIKSKISSVK